MFGYDPWIVELKNNGDLKSQAKIQGSGNNNQVTSMIRVSDPASKDMFAITGFTNSKNSKGDGSFNMFAVKLEIHATGFYIKWSQAYQHSGPDYSYSIDQTADGDLVLAGSGFMSKTNSLDALILKLDPSNGSVKFSIGYGGVYGGKALDDKFYSVQKTKDSGFVVGGYNESFPDKGYTNAWVMSLDKNGNIDKKDDASCMLFGIDLKEYPLDWTFQCLSGYKPIEVKPTSVAPEAIKSTVSGVEIRSIRLCRDV